MLNPNSLFSRLLAQMTRDLVAGGGGKVFRYFYFYVAEVSFAGYAFSLFF
jgi:hypothetical protein